MALSDVSLERAMLGSAIQWAGTHDDVLRLTDRDFTVPAHRMLLATLQVMIRRAQPVDALTLSSSVAASGLAHQLHSHGGLAYVHQLAAGAPESGAFASWYAGELRAMSRARAVRDAAERTLRMFDSEEAVGEIAEIERQARADLADLPGSLDSDRAWITMRELLSSADLDTEWVVPGALAVKERVVIVAGEGVSKTTLLRMWATCLACGVHPWTGERYFPGRRVLFIDTENDEAQTRRGCRWIVNRCLNGRVAPGWDERIVFSPKDGGLNIASRDNAWFRETVAAFAPDVLVLTPAYKLMAADDPKDDQKVLAMFDAIDQVRVQQRCAVLIEQHAPHGQPAARDMRPFGSSVWLRWPEVGIGYQRDDDTPTQLGLPLAARPEFLEAVAWRGMREDRDWPSQIRYGGPRQLPWVPTDPGWEPSVGPLDIGEYDDEEAV